MNIDIWSDVVCPFCYIGKRRLEGALAQFPHRDSVTLIWHSFQLDPGLEPEAGKDLYTYLAERKGMSADQSVRMHQQVTDLAAEAGLEYRFDRVVVANSFNAHRLIQLAKREASADAVEERLFRAYFTEGLDIADHETLIRLGTEAGLEAPAIREVLTSEAFAIEMRADIAAAEQIGVRGVPFFVFDERYAISGAQPESLFLQTLEHAWQEGTSGNPQQH